MKKRLQKKLSKRMIKRTTQKISEGCLGGAHCIECFYFNSNRRSGGYGYCEKHKSWHKPDDYYCSAFSRK